MWENLNRINVNGKYLKIFLIFMIYNWCLYLYINEIFDIFIGIFFYFL